LKKELAYIDSNIFVYPVLYSPETDLRVKKAEDILRDIENGELLAFTSTLTWDEVTWTIRKFLGKSESINQGQKLLNFVNLQFINVDETILTQAQMLMCNYSLKPRDSIHVASAIDRKLKTFISDDQDFDVVKEIKRKPLV
jgi:hypothetical protein